MASFSAGTTFTDGVANDVTAAKLAALVNAATPTSGLIQDRTAETAIAVNDNLLIGDASDSNNLKRMTVANFRSAATFGTTTSTAATITSGTITTLNSTTGTITTGVIPTLTSITKITSGTGTEAAPAISPTGDTNTGIFFPAADTIAFSEGGTEAMRIDSSGNVGIGTGSPTAQVTIGKIVNSATLPSTPENNSISLYPPTTTDYYGGGIGWSTGVNTAANICAVDDGGSGALGIVLSTGNNSAITERLRIDSSGQVGIGETTPLALLHVSGGFFVKGAAAPAPAASATSSLSCGAASGEVQFASNGINNGVYGSYNFYSRKGNSADSLSRMVIDSSGNVGVGTASPSATLDVNGAIRADVLTSGTGTAATPAIYPATDTNTGFFFPAADTIAFTEGGAEAMRINSSGNVSIGTATALSKLHVHGDLTMSNATTAITASTSTITPPATVAGYLTVSINGTSRKIAFYAT